MKNDLIRAFCIAVMVVPIFALSRIAGASEPVPLQPLATTIDDFEDAAKAVLAGATFEEALLEQATPIRKALAFQVDLWEDLFDTDFDLSTNAYFVNIADENDLYSEIPQVFLGENFLSDMFSVSFSFVEECVFSDLSTIEQENIATVGIISAWAIEGDISTDNSTRQISGILVHGISNNNPVWFLIPSIDPGGEFVQGEILNGLSTSPAPGTAVLPANPSTINWACTAQCHSNKQLNDTITTNNRAGCLTKAANDYLAALAACAIAALAASSIFGPVSFLGAGAICAALATVKFANDSTNCYIDFAVDMRNNTAILNNCLRGCGWIIV